MADIDIACDSCGETMTVSEFADASILKCTKCGEPLVKPEEAGKPKQRPTVKRKVEKAPGRPPIAPANAGEGGKPASQSASIFPQDTPGQDGSKPAPQSTQQPTRKTKFTSLKSNRLGGGYLIGSIITFVIVGGLCGLLRYSNVLGPSSVELIKQYGPYLMLGIHAFIFFYACKESIFTGLLCLVAPGYGLYYTFFVSDSFYARAVIGGLLVGIGVDSAGFYFDLFGQACEWVDYTLHHTATS